MTLHDFLADQWPVRLLLAVACFGFVWWLAFGWNKWMGK